AAPGAHGFEPSGAEAGVGLEVVALAPFVERGDEDEGLAGAARAGEADGAGDGLAEAVGVLADDDRRPGVLAGLLGAEVGGAGRSIPAGRDRRVVGEA